MSSDEIHIKHHEVDLHKEVIPIIIPIVSVITILMVIGVVGNAAVIYIYGFQLKKTTVHYFIMVLAVVDIFCCLLGFPLEITELYNYLDYPSDILCKWQRFFALSCSISSGIVLLLISIERYRKVCKPANYQLNLKHAKYFTFGACSFSILLATPATLLVSKTERPLKDFGNQTASYCSLNKHGYYMWPKIYLIILLFITVITLTAMMILYSLLYRAARTHILRQNSMHQPNVNNAEAGKSPAKRQLSRINHTVISITALFIISFFPTLILNIFAEQLTARMKYKKEIIFSVFERMYILNSSFNPLVYGFYNKKFRNAFVQLLRKIFCLSAEKQSSPIET